MLALLLIGATAGAASVGTVTDLNGSLLAREANGALKVLALNSPFEQGDTLATRHAAYARVALLDGSAATLGPDTELRIEKYVFHAASPAENVAVLVLTTGRVRIAAGPLGKLGIHSFTLATPLAAIDIHGATLIAQYVAEDRSALTGQNLRWPMRPAVAVATDGYTSSAVFRHVSMHSLNLEAPLLLAQNAGNAGPTGIPPGLYVQVLDGAINLSNGGGSQNFSAGQFGFTPSFQQPPVILPANPGIQFTPPPSFSTTTGSPTGAGSGTKPGDVDCVVR
jgi:hypothetical protein